MDQVLNPMLHIVRSEWKKIQMDGEEQMMNKKDNLNYKYTDMISHLALDNIKIFF